MATNNKRRYTASASASSEPEISECDGETTSARRSPKHARIDSLEPEQELEPTAGGQQSVLQCLAAGLPPPLTSEMMQHARDAADTAKKSSSSWMSPEEDLLPRRGVTRHSVTGKWEAHLWDGSHVRPKRGRGGGRTRGRQVYLGGWGSEPTAATAYDLGALWFWGEAAPLNYPLERYRQDLPALRRMTQDELVAMLKRFSAGFARGKCQYRGVTEHHQPGKYEARIGRAGGSKYTYLGTFDSAEAAALSYDQAARKFKGSKAVTNFGHLPPLAPAQPAVKTEPLPDAREEPCSPLLFSPQQGTPFGCAADLDWAPAAGHGDHLPQPEGIKLEAGGCQPRLDLTVADFWLDQPQPACFPQSEPASSSDHSLAEELMLDAAGDFWRPLDCQSLAAGASWQSQEGLLLPEEALAMSDDILAFCCTFSASN